MRIVSTVILLAPLALWSQTLGVKEFGRLPDGRAVRLYTLTNKSGASVSITPYGAIVTEIRVPDRRGQMGGVVHGFDALDGYLKEHPYFGAVVGRYGNRIAKGRFTLNGREYKLAVNNGPNHLHGGVQGFDKKLWTVRSAKKGHVTLRYVSPDGEEGYPGKLTVDVSYSWKDDNSLAIRYSYVSDQETVANITNHTYFNLAGSGDILRHIMQLEADRYTPVDAGLIPTGELQPAAGTPFDFTQPMEIGARIGAAHPQLEAGGGYDHNFALRNQTGALARAATVSEPSTGRTLTVLTTEPGVQFYTGNFLDGSIEGRGGARYAKRSAFCLETQHYPDSPNQAGFPSVIRKAGVRYESQTVFRFGVIP